MSPSRVGIGFDVHKFGEGHNIRIFGIDIPFNKRLVGHSDADVGLHAITDAIYGSIGSDDIGSLIQQIRDGREPVTQKYS